MKNHKTLLVLFLILPFLIFAKEQRFSSEARNESGEIVYYEDHLARYNNEGLVEKITTKYLRPTKEREVFATLESTFEDSQFVPNTVFIDKRHQKKEETKVDQQEKTLEIIHTNMKNQKVKKETLELSKAMVLGQGYHNYILANFESFEKDAKRTLDFVVPAKRDFYRFDLHYQGKKEETELVTFRLNISNPFLRLFASHIEVDYDPQTKNLMAYRGLTNIVDDEGENQSLNIKMSYSEEKE